MRRLRGSGGQSLVETAIVLPFLLVLLAGGYWVFHRLSLEGTSTSAAQAQLLRAGRMQTDISTHLATTVVPGGKGVTVSARGAPLAQSIPLFSGLSGRTVSSVDVSRKVESAGGYLKLPPHEFHTVREAAVDSWESGSRSGRDVRRVVRSIVATGALR